MRKPVYWISILIIICTLQVHSQEKWTLDRCISYAFDNNIRLKQQGLNIKIAENKLNQSKLELLPSLGAGASQTFRYGRSVDPLTYDFTTENSRGSSFYGSTEIGLFDGFRELNTIKRNKVNLGIILADFETAKNDLSLNITRLFLQILFNQELVQIAIQQVEVTKLQVKTTKRLADAGSLPQGDILEIQAQLAGEELKLVIAKNQLMLSLLELAQLLDLEDVDNFDIEKPGFENELVGKLHSSTKEIFASAIALMPNIKSAELMVEFYERDLSVKKGLLSPSLSMRGSWGSGYSDRILDFQTNNTMPFGKQIDFASTTSLGINLSIPIFNNFSYQTEIKNSKIALLNSSYQLQLAKNLLRKEIQQAMADASAALEKYNATEKTLTSLQEAFRYTEKKYSLGLLTSLDYNISKNNLFKAQSDLLQAKYNYIFNVKILDFYRGIPVELR